MSINNKLTESKAWFKTVPGILKTILENVIKFTFGLATLTLSLYTAFNVLPLKPGYLATSLAVVVFIAGIGGMWFLYPYAKAVLAGLLLQGAKNNK